MAGDAPGSGAGEFFVAILHNNYLADLDGRVDLALCQNSGATKLYRNQGAAPGLRVRLLGPPGNPEGIGACLRTGLGAQLGPAREIHAGSGYWSSDSPVQVMSLAHQPDRLWIRWPGGQERSYPLPQEAWEVIASPDGKLEVAR